MVYFRLIVSDQAMLNRLPQHSILPFMWIELILKSKCLILYKSMTLCIVEEEENVVMKLTNSECTLAFTAWIGGVNHQLGTDEDPLQPSLLYGHPSLAREAVNTIYGTHFDKHLWWLDWTTGSTKASKNKTKWNYYLYRHCTVGWVVGRMRTISKIQSI